MKNAVGIIGVIVIFGIIIVPLIRVGILYITFYILSGVCELVADEKIVRLFNQIADCYKIFMALLLAVSVMFIIGITIVLKISNSALMYR